MKKNHSTLWKAWLKVVACAFFALAMACSDEGGEGDMPTPTPPPVPDNTTGSIDFSLKGEDGSSLSTQQPVQVGSEEGLELVISQKSSYTDPNGQVYTCEPKASITLEVKTDTVYAKDLKELTAISGTPGKQTESSGTNPVKKQTLQSFSIGGQDVVFDLSHEIYTYTNSKQKKIEMPYISVGEAKFGKGETVESKSASSPVTLRSLAMSRASVTDSTLYEVNAKFNLELATVNTKESQKQTLNFDVKYLAVVENVTELTPVLEYDLEQTEYNLKGGEEKVVTLEQVSKFANGDEAVYSGQPQASVSLKAEKAMVFVSSVDELKALIDTEDAQTAQEGSNPITHTYQKKFATKNQSFELATSHQVYFTNETGEEMPYLKVNEPELIGIEATAKASRASVNDTTYYDVKATFAVELEGVNLKEEHKQTLTFTVDYEGAVVNTIPLTPSLAYTLDQTEYTLQGGEEKEIIITQASQFKNGEQAVFSHEPVAKLKFITGKNTVYADHVEALKEAVAGKAQTGKEGSQPLKHTYSNTWNAGGQTFAFENFYEVYTSASGDEMPYLKVNEPELIGIEATAKGSRASVNDTTYYDVKATFAVELEGINISEEHKQTLTFTVDYEGAVVNTIPLTPSLAYTLDQTEYTLQGGEEKEISITQASQFKNGDQAVFSYEPVTVIKLIVGQETVYADNVEALKTLIESEDAQVSTTGNNPKKHSYQKSLATNGQSFDFSASYEVYNAENGDEMPYLKVGEPRLVSIDAVERTSRATVNDTVFYDVKAVFEVDVEGVNVEKALAQTISFEVNYEGGVVSKTEGPVELVSTSYRKDLIYLEPVGNLIARTSCVVYRDRKYSDGSVQTDSIYGGPWMMLEGGVTIDTSYFTGSIEATFGTVNVEADNRAGIYIRSASVEVPDMSYVTATNGGGMNVKSPGGYSTYWAETDRSAYNSANPVEGWYYTSVINKCFADVNYVKDGVEEVLFACTVDASYYDRFLYVDGKLIDFAEFRPSWDDGVFTTSDVSGGKVYTLECKGSYAGQEVHLKTSVTVTAK